MVGYGRHSGIMWPWCRCRRRPQPWPFLTVQWPLPLLWTHAGQAPETPFILYQSRRFSLFSYDGTELSGPKRSTDLHYQGVPVRSGLPLSRCTQQCWNTEMKTAWVSVRYLQLGCSHLGDWLVARMWLLWKINYVLETQVNFRITIW